MEPLLTLLLTLLPMTAPQDSPKADRPPEPSGPVWVDFSQAAAVDAWRQVHDSVMGGVSSGVALPFDGWAGFRGVLSLENNGGFASFRAAASPVEGACERGLRVAVRGDGQVYRLQLRLDGRWDGVSWQSSFRTVPGAWTVVELPYESFLPTWRGRLVAAAPPLEPADIRQLGVSIADKQSGPFELDMAWIADWRDAGAAAAEPGSLAAFTERTRVLQARLDASPAPSGEELLEDLRWSERLAVIALPGDLDEAASIFQGGCALLGAELAERELRVLLLTGDGAGRLAGRTLSREQVLGLRQGLELTDAPWTLALVGKDGGVKARWSEPVPPAELLERIDAMPMRRDELQQRQDL